MQKSRRWRNMTQKLGSSVSWTKPRVASIRISLLDWALLSLLLHYTPLLKQGPVYSRVELSVDLFSPKNYVCLYRFARSFVGHAGSLQTKYLLTKYLYPAVSMLFLKSHDERLPRLSIPKRHVLCLHVSTVTKQQLWKNVGEILWSKSNIWTIKSRRIIHCIKLSEKHAH